MAFPDGARFRGAGSNGIGISILRAHCSRIFDDVRAHSQWGHPNEGKAEAGAFGSTLGGSEIHGFEGPRCPFIQLGLRVKDPLQDLGMNGRFSDVIGEGNHMNGCLRIREPSA